MAPIATTPNNDRTPLLATQALARLAAPAALRQVEAHLSALPAQAGLTRYTTEQRSALGVTNSAVQLKMSLACLKLLSSRPDLLAHMKGIDPARWQQLVGLRLAVGEARRVLAPTLVAAERADVLLLGALTERCDSLEDQVAAKLKAGDLTAPQRRALKGRFDDPGRVQQLLDESADARRLRRGRRSALSAQALQARRARLDRIIGRQQLREATPATALKRGDA